MAFTVSDRAAARLRCGRFFDVEALLAAPFLEPCGNPFARRQRVLNRMRGRAFTGVAASVASGIAAAGSVSAL